MSSDFAPSTSSFQIRWFFGIALALLLFVVIGYLSRSISVNTPGYDAEQAKLRYAKLAKLREADQKTLTTADWVDQDKQIIRIPIDEAMTKTVDELKAKPVVMCATSAAAAAPATNAAPASPAPATNAAPAAPKPPAKPQPSTSH